MLLALTKESSVIRLESRHLNIAFTDDEQMQTIPLPLIDRAAWENKRERKFKYVLFNHSFSCSVASFVGIGFEPP